MEMHFVYDTLLKGFCDDQTHSSSPHEASSYQQCSERLFTLSL